MAHRGTALRALGRLFERGTNIALSEGALLERYTTQGDTDAFEALLVRHGPMVLGVCRRGLVDPHDVEDAFQATFLVLVRKAGMLRDAEQVGPWLFGVARKVTARARSRSLRRRAREQPVADASVLAMVEPNTLDRKELRSILDEEIGRLPARYRAPVVLCYLEGLTHEEAASRLGCPVGTVRSRMAWARERLRVRLDRRGLAPAGVLAVPVPSELIVSTLSAAARAVSGSLSLTAAGAAALAQGVTTAMFMKKVSVVASVSAIFAASLVAGGAAWTRAQTGDGPRAAIPPTKPTAVPRDDSPASSSEVRALREQNSALQNDIRALLKEMSELRKQVGALSQRFARGARPELDPSEFELGPPPQNPNIPPNRQPLDPTQPILIATPGPITNAPPIMQNPNAPEPEKPSRVPTTQQMGNTLAVVDRTGDQILAKGLGMGGLDGFAGTGKPGSFQLYRSPKGVKILPGFSNTVLALQFDGERISELAVFNSLRGRWSIRTLAQPASGTVTPIMEDRYVLYPIGNRVYSYSVQADRWDAVEFAREPTRADTYFGPSYQDDENLFAFDVEKGVWKRIDFEALAKEAAQTPAKAEEKTVPPLPAPGVR